ncbi:MULTISPECIES: PfaD family polyunsaturated fatty acid/polyketide biosynthesis protein [Agrobacterium]|uniref:PfaD family polyunsaturated fatty acid/polyketide biosynthesis protein n=1 Tax=Agrobacterium TaxID=357 RepID=UPI0022B810F9|nr:MULTISPECIES: PfaD family polyunsaturated fatty acid/polyketide biosynthesis protein [Agrobacterium]MCZ7886508.1 PfaD family polyunsaturated fatty acid/polyketide biosynthesis protein [Agrobacterium salinitolerans]MDA5629155.1 PfaD family polyunsaturated fatty acid/polyketide biosynthesis protein [Agrobacterium sp. ST15.16.055]MDA6979832.1 PfaD family polyunsaturated fatty acid/polyketide biosynthesis protein [Agrobacterium salinitolerans]
MNENLHMNSKPLLRAWRKQAGSPASIETTGGLLADLGRRLYVVNAGDRLSLETTCNDAQACKGMVPALEPQQLGDPAFLHDYGVRMAYYAGAMANGINSEDMVIALGRQGLLGFLGAGGLGRERVASALARIGAALPHGPWGVNLLHNPGDAEWEMDVVRLCIRHGVRVVEASAYMNLSPAVVYWRASGLAQNGQDGIDIRHRIIAKVSRREVAQHFIHPAPEKILARLVEDGLISADQAEMAGEVPMADDITVEANSGGHTDNGVLSCAFPSIAALRDDIVETRGEAFRVRIGAAGGIGNPQAVYAAFAMGAAYVCTGSINQACIEAGTSPQVKALLGRAKMDDVAMAPSADMFEIGSKVQVLKGGTMYAMRAQKLYNLYKQYDGLEDIPAAEIAGLESVIFQKSLPQVWEETRQFFKARGNPKILEAAEAHPKKRMALVFQWYLGQSSRWAISGAKARAVDYQIWCGPAMGAINEWLRGSPYEAVESRSVFTIADLMMRNAAYLARLAALKHAGMPVPEALYRYRPWAGHSAPHLMPSSPNSSLPIGTVPAA